MVEPRTLGSTPLLPCQTEVPGPQPMSGSANAAPVGTSRQQTTRSSFFMKPSLGWRRFAKCAGYRCGGGRSKTASPATPAAGCQSPMPAVHTSVSACRSPERASCSGVNGPWVWPLAATHHTTAGGGGGDCGEPFAAPPSSGTRSPCPCRRRRPRPRVRRPGSRRRPASRRRAGSADRRRGRRSRPCSRARRAPARPPRAPRCSRSRAAGSRARTRRRSARARACAPARRARVVRGEVEHADLRLRDHVGEGSG